MPLPAAAVAAIPAGISFLGGILGNRARRQEARRDRRFQERMRNTAWQAAVADMEAAGINPALAYSQGPAASPGGAMASQMDVLSPGVTSALQTKRLQEDINLIRANVKRVAQEERGAKIAADTALARLQSYGVEYSPTGRLMIRLPGDQGLPRMTREIEEGIRLTAARAQRETATSRTMEPLAELADQLGILLPIIGGVGKLGAGLLRKPLQLKWRPRR